MKNPKVNILVLNWNGEKVLSKCIKSIKKSDYTNYSITIIDNGSFDNSISEFINNKDIKIIKINNNIGYAAGYNYAFSKLKSFNDKYYLILNNDTIININTISTLVNSIQKYGKNNIFGPRIINANNKKNWFCGGKINYITGHPYHRGLNTENSIISFKSSFTEYISGCCMLVSKDIINKLNGFNEKYSFYYEDVDLCIRAKKIDVSCVYITSCSIEHLISYSIGGRFSLLKFVKKIKSFIKFLYLNNNIFFFLFYFIINLFLAPFFIMTYLFKKII